MRIKYIFLTLLFFAVTAAGCKKFLDIVPDERPTEKDAFRDPNAALDFLYSCYSFLPAQRVGQSSIDLMTTDEVVTAFEHEVFAQFPKGQYTASNPVISYWATLYKGIRQSYILIDNVDKTPGLPENDKAIYKAEAKFLIAYYHFLLIRMYGPVIIQTGVADIETDASTYPARSTYDECVKVVVDMLDEAAAGLPAKPLAPSAYGRATSIIAKSVKARMLLYAASPLFNGGGGTMPSFYANFKDKDGKQLIPTTYDKEKWKKAADAAKEAIDLAEANGIALYKNSTIASALPSNPVEKDLRFTFIDKNSAELIWADTRREGIYDFQNKSTPYLTVGAYNGVAPTLTMVETFYTANGLPIDKDPAFNYASRYAVVNGANGTTMSLNLNREPRFNAWIGYHNSNYEIIRGSANFIKVQFRKPDNCGIQSRSNNYSPTGYLNKKGVSPLLVQTAEESPKEQYPWPVIRLAELYLNYAEALIEYGENFTTAKTYIDKVRTRAGIPTVDNAWAAVGGANDQATMRSIVRQERSIELYLENHRFWDLRRWMIAEPYLGVKAKGMNIQGATDADFFKITEVVFPRVFRAPAFYLMPIPIAEINKAEKLIQNPGY